MEYKEHNAFTKFKQEQLVSRREQLEQMLVDSPQDSFLRYALAMELANEEQHDRSIELYKGLMADDPPYVPAFFMLGQQLTKLDRIDEARTALNDGIVQAREQNDMHAAGEMTEFLQSLE